MLTRQLRSEQSAMQRSMTDSVLETLFASLAKFYVAHPLGSEDLCSCQASSGVGIEYRVDDIATASLQTKLA